MNTINSLEISLLNKEDIINLIFIFLAILNVTGNKHLRSSKLNNSLEETIIANQIFTFVIIITILINLYFLIRNKHESTLHPNQKEYQVKVLGSLLFIIGGFCLLYFQISLKESQIGSPTL